MCSENLEDAEEQLRVMQAAANNAHGVTKTAKNETSILEAVYVAEVERRREEVGLLTKVTSTGCFCCYQVGGASDCACQAEIVQGKSVLPG